MNSSKFVKNLLCIFFIQCFITGVLISESELFNQYNMQPDVWHMITPVSGQVDNKGDLNLSIPIVTIPGRNGLDFNVSFSYHAPVKVSQMSTWSGLGWNFDPGSITRDVQGGIDGNPGVDFTDIVSVQPDLYYLTLPGRGTIPMSRSNNPLFLNYLSNQNFIPINGTEFYTHVLTIFISGSHSKNLR
jgi:hypothetical protein